MKLFHRIVAAMPVLLCSQFLLATEVPSIPDGVSTDEYCQYSATEYQALAEIRDEGSTTREEWLAEFIGEYDGGVEAVGAESIERYLGTREEYLEKREELLEAVYGHPERTPADVYDMRYEECLDDRADSSE